VQFLFGDHVLDVDRRELRSSSELIATEPQVFDILVFLLQNHDRVVSKHELIEEVWGGRIVSESTVSSRITAVRKVVGDDGKRQRLIRTLPRRGFRFVGAVRQVPAPAPSAMPFADAATPIVDPPSDDFSARYRSVGADEARCRHDGPAGDRGASVRQLEPRSPAGLFRRRDDGGNHRRTFATALVVGHRM